MKLEKRAKTLILLIAAWTIICISTFFYYAVIARKKYIKLGNKIASRELKYYPIRSKILDKNGVVLAWTEKYYDLYFIDITGCPARKNEICKKTKKLLPSVTAPEGDELHYVMFRGLQPKQILLLEELIRSFTELQIRPRTERKVVNYPKVKVHIGEVKYISGRLVGVSGIEKLHDEILSGTPGKFNVMLDRHKNWIKQSVRKVNLSKRGEDIRIKLSIEEIRGIQAK